MARALIRTDDFDNAQLDRNFWLSHAITHGDIVSVGKGRYLRRKGDPLRQSHDNVLAWAWFSIQHPAINHFAKDIYNFAKWRFFVYQPARPYSLDIRCFLQPSKQFTLKLACNKKPGWISTLWFTGACLVKDHASDGYLKSMLETDIVQAKWHLLSSLKKKVVKFGMELMIKRREGLGRWYKDYFHEDAAHPAVTVW
jgi:hypothetical protein